MGAGVAVAYDMVWYDGYGYGRGITWRRNTGKRENGEEGVGEMTDLRQREDEGEDCLLGRGTFVRVGG